MYIVPLLLHDFFVPGWQCIAPQIKSLWLSHKGSSLQLHSQELWAVKHVVLSEKTLCTSLGPQSFIKPNRHYYSMLSKWHRSCHSSWGPKEPCYRLSTNRSATTLLNIAGHSETSGHNRTVVPSGTRTASRKEIQTEPPAYKLRTRGDNSSAKNLLLHLFRTVAWVTWVRMKLLSTVCCISSTGTRMLKCLQQDLFIYPTAWFRVPKNCVGSNTLG